MSYTLRVLPTEEWPAIEPRFAERGVSLPDERLARIVVAEDAQHRIVGFCVAQLQPHLEPIWIAPEARGKLHWPRLIMLAKEQLGPGPFYAFAPNAHIARMASLAGLTRTAWTVFRGER